MPDHDIDAEDWNQRGSDGIRWFFSLFGIESARAKRQQSDDEQ
jgi:hypothetical protein